MGEVPNDATLHATFTDRVMETSRAVECV
jgi:hypothetical protein